MTKRSKNFSDKNNASDATLFNRLKSACEGWFYMSETDAAVEPFYAKEGDAVTGEALLRATGNATNSAIEEGDLTAFFARLFLMGDIGPKRSSAGPIQDLRQLLEENLSDLKVYRVGRIRIDIYVVGRDGKGHIAGIKTKAVET